MLKRLEELTYEDVLDQGSFLEKTCCHSRYLVPVIDEDEDEGEAVVWVNDRTETIEDPGEADVDNDLDKEEGEYGNL